MTRVPERFRYDITANRIGTARNIMDEAQETAISGRKLRRLSDDPVASVRVFRNREKLVSTEQFRKSLDFSRGFLSKTEDSLRSINDNLIRAKELAVQTANSTWDVTNRSVVAKELKEIADAIVALGNSTYADRYVFGGFKSNTPPISPNGVFSGDDGVIFVQLDEDTFRPVNISGRDVFDVPSEQEEHSKPMVEAVRNLYHALENNDLGQIRSSMNHLDDSMDRVVKALSVVGGRRNAIESVAQRLDTGEENTLRDLNALEGTDTVAAALDLRRAQSALETTLSASSKTLTSSLMDFIK